MKFPRVVVCAFDDWLAAQLREAVAERKWVLKEVRTADGWVNEATTGACVAVVQADPTADTDKALSAVGRLHRANPDADVVVVCDLKLNDDDRPPWTAAALDLGARLVLYPPLTRAVLEDAVVGLMEHRFGSPPPPVKGDEIDLAAGEYEAE
jgi:DNA-binding NarL/FixJ family response regulator